MVLDNKNPVTNGFDVAADSDGDVVVTSVREHGPADKKLAKGQYFRQFLNLCSNRCTQLSAVALVSKS